MKRILPLVAVCAALLAVGLCAGKPETKQNKLDADCEKVLVLSDFETEGEFGNFPDRGAAARAKAKRGSKLATWIGLAREKWQAGPIERSTEHVIHNFQFRLHRFSSPTILPSQNGLLDVQCSS